MRVNPMRTGILGALACMVMLTTLPGPARGEEPDYSALLYEKSPAIVTIKFVLKMKTRAGDRESEREATAVVIQPDGLILCSDARLGGGSAIPTDLKVLIGDDTEGLDAHVITRDPELDLTWLQVDKLGDRTLKYISVKHPVDVEIGANIYAVGRLGKYFDRVAVIRQTRVGGITERPRRLLIPTGGSTPLGLPVFNELGDVVGVTVRQTRESGGTPSLGAGSSAALILPGEDVLKATHRALEAAAEQEEEDADG